MNNQQLYLAIGIPAVLIALAWITNQASIFYLATKIDRMSEQQHSDAMTLQRDIVGLHDRVAKVEKP